MSCSCNQTKYRSFRGEALVPASADEECFEVPGFNNEGLGQKAVTVVGAAAVIWLTNRILNSIFGDGEG